MEYEIKNKKFYRWILSHPIPLIYFINLFIHLSLTIFFICANDIKFGEDPWFEKVAQNILVKNETTIKWGMDVNSDLLTKNSIQIGNYRNWRPIGYSLFLLIPISTNDLYSIVRSVLQSLIYCFIPVLLFLISRIMFKEYPNNKNIGLVAAFAYTLYPTFFISSQQNLDTGFIVLFTITLYYFILKVRITRRYREYLFISVFLFLLLIFRPIAAYTFLIFMIILVLVSPEKRKDFKYFLASIFLFFAISLSFIAATEIFYGINLFNQSNLGYNLFLGNNQYTNNFLIERRADCSTIEDFIIPEYNQKYANIIKLNENDKNQFLLNESLNFIKDNPNLFFENAALKFFGFWSPIRSREGHWTKSDLKETIVLLTYGPLLVLFIISSIWFLVRKRQRLYFWRESIIFICLWMMPYLIFFPTARYRGPIDFLMFVSSAAFIYQIISMKKSSPK